MTSRSALLLTLSPLFSFGMLLCAMPTPVIAQSPTANPDSMLVASVSLAGVVRDTSGRLLSCFVLQRREQWRRKQQRRSVLPGTHISN
jgi:hypothetical protein